MIYVNPTTAPIIYTVDGRTLGAGERTEGELDDTGKRALSRGDLIELPTTQEDAAPEKTDDLPKTDTGDTSDADGDTDTSGDTVESDTGDTTPGARGAATSKDAGSMP